MSSKPRVLFLGRKNPFNLGIIAWLAENFEVIGAFFVEPDRFSWRARWLRISRRAKRYGVVRVVDELAYHVWFWLFDRRLNRKLLRAELPERFHKLEDCLCPHWEVPDPHAPDWLEKLRELKPDFIFVVCCNVILKREFYSIPKLGAFVLHEGIAPEYRGLHTPLWALIERDLDGIGYSLIQITSSIDGGPILVQGRVPFNSVNPRIWSFVGHAALVAGLPAMEQALKRLTITGNGSYDPVSVIERKNRYFTWMRLSTYLRSQIFGVSIK